MSCRDGGVVVPVQDGIHVVNGVAIVDEQPLSDVVSRCLLGEGPDIPAPTCENDIGVEVSLFLEGGFAIKVIPQSVIGLLGCQFSTDGKGTEIVGNIRHAGIFPIDEAKVIVLVDEEVEREEVIMTGGCGESIGVRILLESEHLLAKFEVAGDLNRSVFA